MCPLVNATRRYIACVQWMMNFHCYQTFEIHAQVRPTILLASVYIVSITALVTVIVVTDSCSPGHITPPMA